MRLALLCAMLISPVIEVLLQRIQPFNFPERSTAGDSVNVMCSVTGSVSNTWNYTWRKDGRTINNEGNLKIIGKVSDVSLLVIKPVQHNSGGNYTCEVSGPPGKDSFSAFLKVEGPPKWLESPKDGKVAVNAQVFFSCSVIGTPVPRITWKYINGDEERLIAGSDKYSIFPNGSLRITDAQSTDAGTYLCDARNGIEPGLSKKINLKVQGLVLNPRIQPFNFPAQVKLGETVSVVCIATGARDTWTYTWEKDGQQLKDSTKVRISETGEASVLIIKSVDEESSGNYTCQSRNGNWNGTHTALLSVEAPPKWLESPKDATSGVNNMVQFHCSATGFPKPKITWNAGNDFERMKTVTSNERLTIHTNGTLSIASVSAEDAGIFECTVENAFGRLVSTKAKLKIQEAI